MSALGALFAAVVVVVPTVPAPSPTWPSEVPSGDVRKAIRALPATDQLFVERAGSALATQIALARLAVLRGSTVPVRDLARRTNEVYTSLSEGLRESARRELARLPRSLMTPAQEQLVARIATLKGPAFDCAYQDALAALREEALAGFQREADRGEAPSLSEFANEQLPTLLAPPVAPPLLPPPVGAAPEPSR